MVLGDNMKSVSSAIKQNKNSCLANFNDAMKDEEFKQLIDELNMTYEELAKYTSILKECKVEYSNCQNCRSLLKCKNKVEGYAYLPHNKNGKLIFEYKRCRRKKKLDEKIKYLSNVYHFDIPAKVIAADVNDIYKTDKNRFETIKYLTSFISDYKNKKTVKGLYLHGSFGCGKTYLITAFLNELAKDNIQSSIIFWPEYLRMLKSSFYKDEEFKRNFDKVKTTPILLIDDIGAENTTAWGRDEILCPILQYRMEENLPTFFTSNLSKDALEKHFSITKEEVSDIKAKRIIERINQLTNEIEMVSKNLRN